MNKLMAKQARAVHMSLQDFFLIISKCWLSIIMLLFGIYAFLINDQGRDIMTAFNEYRHWGLAIGAALCLFFWSVESWFGARIVLNLSDVTNLNKSEGNTLQKLLPRILGLLSITVFYISYLCCKNQYWWGDLMFLFVPFILFWFFIIKRRALVQKLNEYPLFRKFQIRIDITALTSESIKYSHLNKSGKRFLLFPVFLFPLLVLMICLFPIAFPSQCTPSVIILLGMAVWTGLASAFGVLEKVLKVPVVIITAAFILVFSIINNNHTVRLKTPESLVNPAPITSNLDKWVTTDTSKQQVLYIACGEGGGIRAAYWTASILASLTDSMKTFSQHLYAISTVSGSSLGAGLYNSLLYAQSKGKLEGDSLGKSVRKFMSVDYLSPVAAAFLFPDALQRFLFFPVGHFDRARYLEWSWEKGWEKSLTNDMNPFSDGTFQLWSNGDKLPNLFLNATHTENGRRVIASNLSWDENAWQAKNISSEVGNDMPLSTSALLSARFPVITPGAKIEDPKNKYRGTVVDGGYYDNYGVITAMDVYREIRKKYSPQKVKVVVLCIRNGNSVPENPKPIGIAYELRTVPTTFLKAWSVRPEKSLKSLTDVLVANGDIVYTIDLDRNKTENLPLGWFLSQKAISIMDCQLKSNKWEKQKKEILSLMK